MPGRKSDEEARKTRRRILDHAADMASVQGLDGISLGDLAAELEMSKAGVVGQFGSKEQLQLETLDHAVKLFTRLVWAPTRHRPHGLPRLLAICESWVQYLANPPLRGGCFLSAAAFEWDDRPGPVGDALRVALRNWTEILEAEITGAVEAGDLPADADPRELAYTLDALAAAATPARQLYGSTTAVDLCRRAMRSALDVTSDHSSVS